MASVSCMGPEKGRKEALTSSMWGNSAQVVMLPIEKPQMAR